MLITFVFQIKIFFPNKTFKLFMATAVKTRAEEGFHLEVEDYLNGLLMLSSELVAWW